MELTRACELTANWPESNRQDTRYSPQKHDRTPANEDLNTASGACLPPFRDAGQGSRRCAVRRSALRITDPCELDAIDRVLSNQSTPRRRVRKRAVCITTEEELEALRAYVGLPVGQDRSRAPQGVSSQKENVVFGKRLEDLAKISLMFDGRDHTCSDCSPSCVELPPG
eukprot:TRINITY_DN44472_c0_g1_i1.p1 TRINITY_DN44472_c0_g1~~TRINITY_DN44472_c0_g1_i1.p1  ORF type:complete len:169 (-),score=10.06 TRINITY_DN44472_c0_g1_i1:165-671(-)